MTPPASRDRISLGRRLAALRESRIGALSLCWDRVFATTDRRDRFLLNMVELYHYVRMSCPLMEAAAARLDGRNPVVAEYLRRHIEEERGHDGWVLDDLQRLGFCRRAIQASLPRRETMALVGTQLYLLERIDSVALLGYIYALESSTPTADTVAWYGKALDIPDAALSSFREHAEIDWRHHVEELEGLLDEHVTHPEAQHLVEQTYIIVMEQLAELALAIAEVPVPDGHLVLLREIR